tara:strand:- start:225 stop:824 length:600 start_codon:yes stop_codon:yes gene_type:complete
MNTDFWIHNPNVLVQDLDIWPTNDMSCETKYNAVSRIIIILTVIGFVATKSYELIFVAFMSLGMIVYLYKTKDNTNRQKIVNTAEGFLNNDLYDIIKPNLDKPKVHNPFSNVMLNSNNEKKIAPPAYNEQVNAEIKENVKKAIKQCNPDNTEIDKLFKEVGDNEEFDSSLRNFYSTPNTQIPNDQGGFVDFCYGDLAKK